MPSPIHHDRFSFSFPSGKFKSSKRNRKVLDMLTITQPKCFGDGDRQYTMEEYVELFTFHSRQLFKVLDDKDPDFAENWQEMMDFDKKIEKLALKRFVSIYDKQNS